MTGNQLKILALAAMTLDHIGVILLPQFIVLRIIGRLAFPIFAFMIAEGCFYTHDKRKYLGGIIAVGVLCQAVYFVAVNSVEQSIMTTLALGIVLVYAFQWWAERAPVSAGGKVRVASVQALVPIAALAFTLFVCEGLPTLLANTDFSVDYGFCGAVLPLLVYLPRLRDVLAARVNAVLLASRSSADAALLGQTELTGPLSRDVQPLPDSTRRKMSLVLLAAGLVALSLTMIGVMRGVQWFSLIAVALLATYNGKRGTWKLKYLFYVYYPLHLAAIWGLAMLLA